MSQAAVTPLLPQGRRHFDWEDALPPTPKVLWRHRWKEYAQLYGLPFSRGHMQNLDSRGEGPSHVVQFGRVAYTRDALVTWLNSHQGSFGRTCQKLQNRHQECGL